MTRASAAQLLPPARHQFASPLPGATSSSISRQSEGGIAVIRTQQSQQSYPAPTRAQQSATRSTSGLTPGSPIPEEPLPQQSPLPLFRRRQCGLARCGAPSPKRHAADPPLAGPLPPTAYAQDRARGARTYQGARFRGSLSVGRRLACRVAAISASLDGASQRCGTICDAKHKISRFSVSTLSLRGDITVVLNFEFINHKGSLYIGDFGKAQNKYTITRRLPAGGCCR